MLWSAAEKLAAPFSQALAMISNDFSTFWNKTIAEAKKAEDERAKAQAEAVAKEEEYERERMRIEYEMNYISWEQYNDFLLKKQSALQGVDTRLAEAATGDGARCGAGTSQGREGNQRQRAV